ncbi:MULTISPECIES: Hsp20/alpha crystallin family protein [unclassified Bradyrhizobium]|uniref:Hsp20/alpha crystallin family protein n=1 Tax=unclassified Bradyrhizobium TaxID=2631580 RepID=UPI002478D475|nr:MULTISPECIES: Hsp20/alpha crystallin family protein [unclassified Bradyrhizobium]WGR70038.1 Hsp20/alpha crystallin family protein [Bradyrhizobium sp. ISRA426]WGR82095.1 Hsp20/alpha crystallin family protein [Bradyrhizobium sp. ISRA430]WGR85281.1 Hsp20/alpha crystallin family protein [Bradyrhizobium sp. ISRA432]
MAIRDLIPWSRNQELAQARDSYDPFMTLHREMNRLFDDVFRGFGGSGLPLMKGRLGWPRIELSDTDKTLTISAELPGMTEKDVQIEITNGVLTIRGEKKDEHKDEGKYFTERYYGAFERQIPLEDVDEDKAEASFKDGVLTISLPKSEKAQAAVKRIAISTH